MIDRELTGLVDLPTIDGRIYTDQALFEQELERIFGRCWVYVAHVSELREPGDFRTVMVGRNPVLVVRDVDGQLRAMYNRCRHRAATVCQDPSGNSRQFQCIYHGWTYDTRGRLLGVTDPSGYDGAVSSEGLGLVEVAALDTVHGFVFVRLGEDGPTLAEHLGGVADYMRRFCEVAPDGEIDVFGGVQRSRFDANWKLALENGVDSYHPAYLHRTVLPKSIRASYHQEEEVPGEVLDVDGHGVLDMTDCPPLVPGGPPESALYLSIFPNLVLVRAQIRVVQPMAVDRTHIHTQAVRLRGLPDDVNEERLRVHEFAFGPAGVIGADDYEAFERVQAGVGARAAEPMLVSRGLHREERSGGYPRAKLTDETPIRAVYRSWARWMRDGAATEEG